MTSPPTPYECADIYLGLRQQILELSGTPDAPRNEQGMIAYMMETGYPNAIVTLVAAADGTASLYFSSGGGILGTGQQNPAVAELARQIVAYSGQYVPHLSPEDGCPLPSMGQVRFHLVSSTGTVTGPEATQEELGGGQHALSQLFYAGHQLMTAIREHTPPQ